MASRHKDGQDIGEDGSVGLGKSWSRKRKYSLNDDEWIGKWTGEGVKKKRKLGMTPRVHNALRIYLSSVDSGKRMCLQLIKEF